MKKIISLFLVVALFLAGCGISSSEIETTDVTNIAQLAVQDKISLDNVEDPSSQDFLDQLELQIEEELAGTLGDDYIVETVEATYVSKEYLEEAQYNSQENIYFGYKLSEIESQFQGEKYVFDVDESGNTVVHAFEAYDDTMETVIKNVAIGAGIILVCVVITVVTAGLGLPAIAAVFAASATGATTWGLSGAAISGGVTAVVDAVEGKDLESALKDVALNASEGFKWGSIGGAVTGGGSELFALGKGCAKGLTMNEVAMIQKESKLPASIIGNMKSMEEYNIYKAANLEEVLVNGRAVLLPKGIDWGFKSELGGKMVTNLERVKQGYAAIDPASGLPYELHHIGQSLDSPLAVLTREQHRGKGISSILHDSSIADGKGVHALLSDSEWAAQRSDIWKGIAELVK